MDFEELTNSLVNASNNSTLNEYLGELPNDTFHIKVLKNEELHDNDSDRKVKNENQEKGGSLQGQPANCKDRLHHGERSIVLQHIIDILQTKRRNSTTNWHSEYPHMHKRLEALLYTQASDIMEYENIDTLYGRIQAFVCLAGHKIPRQEKVQLGFMDGTEQKMIESVPGPRPLKRIKKNEISEPIVESGKILPNPLPLPPQLCATVTEAKRDRANDVEE